MSARSRFDALLAFALSLLAAVFVLKLFVGERSGLYRDVLTAGVLLYVAAIPKLLAFAAGSVFAYGCSTRFAAGTPTRRAWVLMTIWQGTWFVAQAILGSYQLIRLEAAPFPSLADAFFFAGYPAMIAACVMLLRSYVATGMVGEAREHRNTAIVAAAPLFVAGGAIIAPLLREGGDPLDVVINVAYPAFDLLALIPTIVLLRLTVKKMGGALYWVWALISVGLVFMVAGDLLFGYFELLGLGVLEPLLDLCYITAYSLVTRGIYQQYRISREG